jgi:hypothetical protein
MLNTNENLFIKKDINNTKTKMKSNITVYRSNDIDTNNIQFGNYSKEGNNIYIPIYNSLNKHLFVQFENLLLVNLTENTLVTKMELNSNNFKFISDVNNYTESNLKNIIKKIKTQYSLTKKFTYDTDFKFNDKICMLDLSYTNTHDFKIFNSNKELISFDNLQKYFIDTDNYSSFSSTNIIAEPYLQMKIDSGDLTLKFDIRQLKINEIKRQIHVLEEYSFVDDFDNIDHDTATETYVSKNNNKINDKYNKILFSDNIKNNAIDELEDIDNEEESDNNNLDNNDDEIYDEEIYEEDDEEEEEEEEEDDEEEEEEEDEEEEEEEDEEDEEDEEETDNEK